MISEDFKTRQNLTFNFQKVLDATANENDR